MKHAKKLLALLLALALALGIAIFAMAEEPDVPYIVTQPQEQTYAYGTAFTVSVQVYLPEGWTAEYQWYFNSLSITGLSYFELPGATASSMRLSPGDYGYPHEPFRPYMPTDDLYYCQIIVRDENGVSTNLTSEVVRISIQPDPWGKFKWTLRVTGAVILVVLFPIPYFIWAMIRG